MIQKSPWHLRLQNVCSWKSHHHHPYFQGLMPFWCFLSSKEIYLCLRHPTFCWPVGLYCRHMYVSWLSLIFNIYLCQFCLLCSVLVWRWYVFNYPQILVWCLWLVNCNWLRVSDFNLCCCYFPSISFFIVTTFHTQSIENWNIHYTMCSF